MSRSEEYESMSVDDKEYYEKRIHELQQEVADREQDLATYRSELAGANKKLERIIQQVSQEIKLAQGLQRALVPTEYPNIQGVEFSTKFIPSMVSGGDYFDIFEIEDRFRYGVILAASSGHAMSALLLSVLLKLTTQMEAKKGEAAENVMTSIANEIVPSISGDDKADVFYSVMDRRSYEMAYCLAGDIVALHQDYVSEEVNFLNTNAAALGVDFEEGVQSSSISLNPRDRIILCTPGIVQSENLEGECFGKERLIQSILKASKTGVHEVRNEILLQLKNFSHGQEAQRDQTVVVQEVKDRVIKLAKR